MSLRFVEVPIERARRSYLVRLHFGWVRDRHECVKVEIESDPEHPQPVTTSLIRSVPFGRLIGKHRVARDIRDLGRKIAKALDSGDEQQIRRFFKNPVVRDAAKRHWATQRAEQPTSARRGPAPRFTDAEVARLYNRMRRERPEAPLQALAERLGVSYWSAGQRVHRARDRGHLPTERGAAEGKGRGRQEGKRKPPRRKR